MYHNSSILSSLQLDSSPRKDQCQPAENQADTANGRHRAGPLESFNVEGERVDAAAEHGHAGNEKGGCDGVAAGSQHGHRVGQLVVGSGLPVLQLGRVADALLEAVGAKGAEGNGGCAIEGADTEEEHAGECNSDALSLALLGWLVDGDDVGAGGQVVMYGDEEGCFFVGVAVCVNNNGHCGRCRAESGCSGCRTIRNSRDRRGGRC